MDLECTQGVLVISGGKHDRRHGQLFRFDHAHHVKSIHSGHTDIEEKKRWPGEPHQFHGFAGRRAFPNNLDVRYIAEELTQLLPGQHLVIGHYRLNHSAPYRVISLSAAWDNWNGKAIVTLTCVLSICDISKEQFSP